MLENPVLTLDDLALQKQNSVLSSCSQHAARMLSNGGPANSSTSMTRSDSHKITIPGGKRRVETADANSAVESPPKQSHNALFDATGQHNTTKRRSMYIPHKSQPSLLDSKPHTQSSTNPEVIEGMPTVPLSISHTPVSIATYRSCITCLTPISIFDAGEICPSCRLSLSAYTSQTTPGPQPWPNSSSLTTDAMSALLDSQDTVNRRPKVGSDANIRLAHPAEFDISPTRRPTSGPSTSSKRRKVSHQDPLSVRNTDGLISTSTGHPSERHNKAVASNPAVCVPSVTDEQPNQTAEKFDGSGILKLGRSRSSLGAKKVSWADRSGGGCLEIGPSHSVSSVKIEESDNSLQSQAEGPKRSLTIKIKALSTLPRHQACDTDVIEGWDSDLTELSESDDETSSGSDVPLVDSEVRSAKPSTGLKIRLPPRTKNHNLRVCASSRCKAELASDYRWKSCVLCRSRNREYQRKRQNLQGRHWRLEDELIDGQRNPSTTMSEVETSTVAGARLCLMRRCSFIIPSTDEYASKFCSLCRLFRKSKKALGMSLAAGTADGANGVRLAFTAALHDLPRRAKLGVGRCIHADCGMFVSSTRSKLCEQCQQRKRFILRWVSEALSSQLPEGTTLHHERSKPTVVPEYLSLKPLLADLRSRARAFLRSQALFFLFNEPTSPDLVKASFTFEGEYATVNPDLDIAMQKDDVRAKTLQLKKIIEEEINIQFGSEESHHCVEDGFHFKFLSSLKVPVLEAVKHGDATEIKSGTKEMKGELSISVLKDNSHPFIPGEKRIVRFHMIG